MNKKAKLLILALPLLAMSLAGCGENNDPTDSSGSDTTSTTSLPPYTSGDSSDTSGDSSDTSSSSSEEVVATGIDSFVKKPSSIFKDEVLDVASVRLKIALSDGTFMEKNAESIDLDISGAHHGDVVIATAHYKTFTKDFNLTVYEPNVLNSVFTAKDFVDGAGTWDFDGSDTNKTSWQAADGEKYPSSGVVVARNKIDETLYPAVATSRATIKNILRVEVDYFIKVAKNGDVYEGKGRGPISVTAGGVKLTENVEQIKDGTEATRVKTFKFDFSEAKPESKITLEATCETSSGGIVINAVRIYSIVEQTGIYMLSAPSNLNYVEGDTFSSEGLIVVPSYSDGSHGNASQALAYTLKVGEETFPSGTLSIGNYDVDIYAGDYKLEDAFTVNVRAQDVTLTSVTIDGDMTKKTYVVGEEWDTDGLIVKAHYSNGDETELLHSQVNFTFDPATPNETTIDNVDVIATYSEVASLTTNITGISVIGAEFTLSFTKANLVSTTSSYAESNLLSPEEDFRFKIKANQTSGETGYIGLNKNNTSYPGFVTTKSNGRVKSITITWNDAHTTGSTEAKRRLNVWGKNSPYGETYDVSKASGDLITAFTYDQNPEHVTQTYELTNEQNFHYIAFTSNDGAIGLDSVSITFDRTDKPLELLSYEVTGTPVAKVHDATWDLSGVTVMGQYEGLNANITSSFLLTTETAVPSDVIENVDVVVTAQHKLEAMTFKDVTLKGNVGKPDPVLDSLSYTGTPTKDTYTTDEDFDPTGITVYANYTEPGYHDAKDVTASVVWDDLVAGTTATGSYTENGVTKSVTITGLTITQGMNVAASYNFTRDYDDYVKTTGQRQYVKTIKDAEENVLATYEVNDTKGKSSSDTFFVEDGTTVTSSIVVKYTNAMWTTCPTTVTFEAVLGGGSVKALTGYEVYVSLLDADGNEIAGTSKVLCDSITDKLNTQVSVSYSGVNNVYGLKITHAKMASYNLRYVSFDLKYSN